MTSLLTPTGQGSPIGPRRWPGAAYGAEPALSFWAAERPGHQDPLLESRDFLDADSVRESIYKRVQQELKQALQGLENERYRLEVSDLSYSGPGRFRPADERRAIINGETLHRRLRATFRLVDKATGQVLDEKRTVLAHVPYLTPRGTFILNGNEYTLANQVRLRPGVYVRRRQSGEVEAQVNVLPGKGVGHRLMLDPRSGVFYLTVGQARVPLAPVLQALGVPEKQLEQAWGREIYAANARFGPEAVDRAARAFGWRPRSGLPAADFLREKLMGMELDPAVTQRTLGLPVGRTGPDLYLRATQKVLAVHRGAAEPDDRDHIAYQTVFGYEDLFGERARTARAALQKALWRASQRGRLPSTLAGAATPALLVALLSSGLGQPTESINPGQVLDQLTRVSRMGLGGIRSTDQIPDEARGVHPSYFGFIDPLVTPESMKAGVDVRVSLAARKGQDGKLYSPFWDPKRGRVVWLSSEQAADAVIAFPGELQKGSQYVAAMAGGKLQYVPRDRVTHEALTMDAAFAPLTNLVPLKATMKGQRAVMAQRMIGQALPLVNAEAPLVQSATPGRRTSYDRLLAPYFGAVRAKRGGEVLAVGEDYLRVRYDDGTEERIDLYRNLPYNRKTYLDQQPLVKPGDRFEPGQLLAKSNYVDKSGAVALGLNARVAYLPYKGWNFEDAIVVSESFAQRAASQHLYEHGLDTLEGVKLGKKPFIAAFPDAFSREQLDKLDENGVIRPGMRVNKGDPLILALKQRDPRFSLRGGAKAGLTNAAVTWEHPTEGVVVDVGQTKLGPVVYVRTTAPLEVGDKLSGRYGDKGVVAAIIPDEKMPRDAQGRPFEVLLNPLGMISRVNPAQVVEAALGKVAAATGKPYLIEDFSSEIDDYADFALKELQKHGLNEKETVYDPESGREIPNVFTGVRYLMKLHHTAESKLQGRATASYTAEGTPAKGGEEGAKRIALLETNALLSHGAFENIRDVRLARGQVNPDYWRILMAGGRPPLPETHPVFQKYINTLVAAGINVVPRGTKLNVYALGRSDVEKLTGNRLIQNSETVRWRKKNLEPVPGGLFDPRLTGGPEGNQWAAIQLPEPLPNPVMEEPIRRVLGLTQPQLEAVLAGQQSYKGRTGPQAIVKALEEIRLPQEIERLRAALQEARGSKRDQIIRVLRYLEAAKRAGQHPREWVWDRVPVIPPRFRPLGLVEGKDRIPVLADANYLYQDLIEAIDAYKQLKGQVDDLSEERLAIYKALQAVVGLGDPIGQLSRRQQVKGLLRQVFGKSAKFGMLQRKLLANTVDLVGRAVITPDPELDLDEVAIPEEKAWTVYKPFIVRRLVRRGVPVRHAVQLVEQRDPEAKEALLKEMEERPVIISRAPVLHRYGIMAFRPRLTQDRTLHINPFIVVGFNADFDGNCVVGSTRVVLRIDRERVEASPLGPEWLRALAPVIGSRPDGSDTDVVFSVAIEELPQLGEPRKDRNGALVYPVPGGVRALAYSPEAGLRWQPVRSLTVEESCFCTEVTTASGRHVVVSRNESLLAFDPRSGQLERKRPAEALGCYVPVVLKWPEPAPAFGAPVPPEDPVPLREALFSALVPILEQLPAPKLAEQLRERASLGAVPRDLGRKLIDAFRGQVTGRVWEAFQRRVEDESVGWDRIVALREVGQERVYDLSVAEDKVFALENGLIIWDTMQFHVPSTEEAAREALEKLLPSRNLIAPQRFEPHQLPLREFLGGLYIATHREKKGEPVVFRTAQEAIEAYKAGRISIDQPIAVLEVTKG